MTLPTLPRERLYTGPAVPTAYDPSWGGYTNLTAAQIAWFQSHPQDLLNYAAHRRWLAEISGTSAIVNGATVVIDTNDRSKTLISLMQPGQFKDVTGTYHALDASGVKAVQAALAQHLANLYGAEAKLASGINKAVPAVTSRKQIDTVYGTLAPRSPSATNPAP